MINYRFNPLTSYVILGVLVGGACIIIWFTIEAYQEIAEIEVTIAESTIRK
jgi:hypothetical protein